MMGMQLATGRGMKLRHDQASPGAIFVADGASNLAPLVLVIDDAVETRRLITLVLRARGYRVLEAGDGLVAKLILMTEQPDLVISDLEMPVCDGWAVLAFCHEHCPGLPVMIVSGGALGLRPEVECWAAGTLPKPFDVARLRAEVERLVPTAA